MPLCLRKEPWSAELYGDFKTVCDYTATVSLTKAIVKNLQTNHRALGERVSFGCLGWNSSLGSLSCLMQCCGFNPPLRRILPGEEIFPLELKWF